MIINTIVTAVDLNDDLSDVVIKAGIAMAERFGAKLHIIDAWPAIAGIGFPYARSAELKEVERHSAARKARQEALEDRVRNLEPRAITFVPIGDAPDAISRYAANESADILVIGSHQKGLFERMMKGSTSSKLLHDAPCALFLVTPGFSEKLGN